MTDTRTHSLSLPLGSLPCPQAGDPLQAPGARRKHTHHRCNSLFLRPEPAFSNHIKLSVKGLPIHRSKSLLISDMLQYFNNIVSTIIITIRKHTFNFFSAI